MDEILEIILAVVVISVVGMGLLFVFNGQSGSFTDFMGNQSQGAECDMLIDKFQRKYCGPGSEDGDGTNLQQRIKDECVPDYTDNTICY